MLSSSTTDMYRRQTKPEAQHYDSQRARCRNKTLLTQLGPTKRFAGATADTDQSGVYFVKDSTRYLAETTEDIPKQVCAQTGRLPSATTLLSANAKDDTFYRQCSMNEVCVAPLSRTRSCSLHAKLPRTVEMPRKRIGQGTFSSDGLDTWVKDGTCTRQIAPWKQQFDVYCSNKHLPHACFPREYSRLMHSTKGSFNALLRRESEKVELLRKIKADHRDVLSRIEKLKEKGVHGLANTRIPGQLRSLERMHKDTSIPMEDAFYYYGFHPFPMEAVEEQYEVRASASHKTGETPGLFLWSSQKLRVK